LPLLRRADGVAAEQGDASARLPFEFVPRCGGVVGKGGDEAPGEAVEGGRVPGGGEGESGGCGVQEEEAEGEAVGVGGRGGGVPDGEVGGGGEEGPG